MTEQVQKERDPILDKEVTFTFSVENLNVILSLLSELPYNKVSSVVATLKDGAIKQLREQAEKEAAHAAAENTQSPAAE